MERVKRFKQQLKRKIMNALIDKENPLNEIKNATHFLKTTCTNYNGEVKTVYTFLDLSADWFGIDESERNSKFPVANGGTLGKIESINANIGALYRNDKSIKEYQTDIYKTNPLQKYPISFCKVVKEDEQNI